MSRNDIDQILNKLAKDVEAAVHALYRGEVKQSTAKARTSHVLSDARTALRAAVDGVTVAVPAPAGTGDQVAVSPRTSSHAPSVAGKELGWSNEDSDAVLKCIMSWLPVGAPASTAPDTKCIAAGRMLVPTWAERERARESVRRITTP